MSANYIKFPEPANTLQPAEDFHVIASMPGIIGYTDGMWIPFVSPGGGTAEQYRYRKGHFALNIMTLCDSKMCFTNVISSCLGSFDDKHIFDNSWLCKNFKEPLT